MVAPTVDRIPDGWQAWRGAEPAGLLRAWVRPDQRCWLSFRDCHRDAYHPLAAAARAELPGELYTWVDEPRLGQLTGLGFRVWRQERYYRIPVGAVRIGRTVPPPADVDLISAAEADLDRLRELDDALRQEIPGSDGWRWTPEEFREQTFSAGFDPATYQVAVDRGTGDYLGLLRVWLREQGPRLGCLGVRPAYRGTRVTPALLRAVFDVLRERGYAEVETDIDATNRAANALAVRCGAVHTADLYAVVLRRQPPGAGRSGTTSGVG